MTANKLADELADWFENENGTWVNESIKEAATMLRQQQAEIESLKQSIWAYEQPNEYIDKTQNKIKYDITIKWDDKTTHHSNVSGNTPLHYNEPKTLTDEEILNICWQKGITWWKLNDGDMDEQTMIDFARAILRKAQEK